MRTIIAANWKMYKTRSEAFLTAHDLANRLSAQPISRDVVLFAPFTALDSANEGLKADNGTRLVELGAQDVYPSEEGAFTGEISPAQIQDCGATWVLAGHSERRHIIGESPALIARKVQFALQKNLSVMLCIGETLEEREAGKLEHVLRGQIESVARVVEPQYLSRFAIAYEPVWAIGTGRVASEADILDAHAMVRRLLSTSFGSPAASLPILYGGSVKPNNASSILALDNVNGVLVGGASLKAESFEAIIRA